MNIKELITEKYLDSVIDDNHYLELLESFSFKKDKQKVVSMNVMNQSDITEEDIKRNKIIKDEYDNVPEAIQFAISEIIFINGMHKGHIMLPAEAEIAKKYYEFLKRYELVTQAKIKVSENVATVIAFDEKNFSRNLSYLNSNGDIKRKMIFK